MVLAIFGAALLAFSCASYWRLLPRNGQVHPLVERIDGGSMLTIGVMCLTTAGLGLLLDGLFG